MKHVITFADGETEDCWCSAGKDHGETEGDWDKFADDEDDF